MSLQGAAAFLVFTASARSALRHGALEQLRRSRRVHQQVLQHQHARVAFIRVVNDALVQVSQRHRHHVLRH